MIEACPKSLHNLITKSLYDDVYTLYCGTNTIRYVAYIQYIQLISGTRDDDTIPAVKLLRFPLTMPLYPCTWKFQDETVILYSLTSAIFILLDMFSSSTRSISALRRAIYPLLFSCTLWTLYIWCGFAFPLFDLFSVLFFLLSRSLFKPFP